MRAARIENNVVVDLWEVPSLTCFEGITLIESPDFVSMGASYDGNSFVNPPAPEDTRTYAEKRQAAYAPLSEQLDMQYWDAINNTETWLDHIRSVKEAHPKEGE